MAAGQLGRCPGARPRCAGHERPRRPGAAAAVPAGGDFLRLGRRAMPSRPPARHAGGTAWPASGAATALRRNGPTLAELLAKHGHRRAADELFAIALRPVIWGRLARHALLRQRAGSAPACRAGKPWRKPPRCCRRHAAGAARRRSAGRVERAHAGRRGRRAGQRRRSAVHLRLRQAVLCPDPVRAGDILWQLSQSEELPKERFSWAWHLWNDTKRGDRVIHAAELWLRRREGAAAIRPVGIGRGVPRGRPRWRRPSCRERSPVCQRLRCKT